MRRFHVFELEDQPWFPAVVRDAGMAFLRFAADRGGQAENIRPVIERTLQRSGEREILDLCSGGGGPTPALARALGADGKRITVTLTDMFPSASAHSRLAASGAGCVRYERTAVDATAVPPDRSGLRTLFNCFHHFRPEQAVRILASAVAGAKPIVVVEVLQRRWVAVLAMIFVPLIVVVVMPFLRPLRISWLFLTYAVPVIPLYVLWDGMISVLRVYTREELLVLAEQADPSAKFAWTVEEIPMPPQPVPGIALIGIPKAMR